MFVSNMFLKMYLFYFTFYNGVQIIENLNKYNKNIFQTYIFIKYF